MLIAENEDLSNTHKNLLYLSKNLCPNADLKDHISKHCTINGNMSILYAPFLMLSNCYSSF